MRRKKHGALLERVTSPRALRPVAAVTLPAFAAVVAVLGCSSAPAITAEPVWIETVAAARALPASDPHEAPPTPPEEPKPVLAAPPAKKPAPPKHPKPPVFIAPTPIPYMLGGDIESVRVAPKIVRERQA